MTDGDTLTSRIGDVVKVEIRDAANPHGTMANYANVSPHKADDGTRLFVFSLASGASGSQWTEREAINAAARALRRWAKENS